MRIVNGSVVLCLLGLGACSSEQVYEGLKAGHDADCLNYPDAEYRECIEESRDSYEQYKQQRGDAGAE